MDCGTRTVAEEGSSEMDGPFPRVRPGIRSHPASSPLYRQPGSPLEGTALRGVAVRCALEGKLEEVSAVRRAPDRRALLVGPAIRLY